jgi:tagatose 6-phosphate kinase
MILCLGATPTVQRTMVFDRLVIDAVNRAGEVALYASGKSINVARVLHSIGRESLELGFIGGDSGKYIRDELDRQQVRHDFVTVEPSTRTCTTIIDKSGHTVTELVEESAAVGADAYESLFAKFATNFGRAKGVVLSGSLTPQGPVDFYHRCVSAAVAGEIPVVLDAKGEPLRRALPARPTVVKPNRVELEETVGVAINDDPSLRDAIRKLVDLGPQWVVVTNGSKPTVASDGRSFWEISTPKIDVVNPIGSGDSFAAGLAAGISDGQSVAEACRLAVACGAANAMTLRGGDVRLDDVNRLLSQITIRLRN